MARIVRRKTPREPLSPATIRTAKPFLLCDFRNRCAYSMQHWKRAGGKIALEIEHFDPRRKAEPEQDYENLMLAARQCNRSKWNYWLTEADLAIGGRFLNPCREVDYGEHLVEVPPTGFLRALTPAGSFHLRHCDLNEHQFVSEREQRTRLLEILRAPWMNPPLPAFVPVRHFLEEMLRTMIPEIPSQRTPSAPDAAAG